MKAAFLFACLFLSVTGTAQSSQVAYLRGLEAADQYQFDQAIRVVQENLGDEQKMAEHFAHWRARAAEVERDIARSERIKAEVRAERAQQRKAA